MPDLSIPETIEELDAIAEYFSEERGAVPVSLLTAQIYLQELLECREELEKRSYADFVSSDIQDKLELLNQ